MAKLIRLLESRAFTGFIVTVIAINAATLGLETDPGVMARFGPLLTGFDAVALGIYCVELGLKLVAYRGRFFRDPWNLFDAAVVGLALMPQTGAFQVLRALRVLRVLRLVAVVPSMRRVVGALLSALPGMGCIGALLALIIYVAAVMATKLFGSAAPAFFGTLGDSLFSLFQIMTVEGWPDIARQVMEVRPGAWLFFVVYLLVSTFAVLNLFIAVVVNAMQEQVAADLKRDEAAHAAEASADREQLLLELRELRAEVRALVRPGSGEGIDAPPLPSGR
jgi:voltage-gated sodium channel